MGSETKTERKNCWCCGAEYTPLVIHTGSGPGGARIPQHDRRGLEGEPCPAGGYRVPTT